jgi:hypothetical protein
MEKAIEHSMTDETRDNEFETSLERREETAAILGAAVVLVAAAIVMLALGRDTVVTARAPQRPRPGP